MTKHAKTHRRPPVPSVQTLLVLTRRYTGREADPARTPQDAAKALRKLMLDDDLPVAEVLERANKILGLAGVCYTVKGSTKRFLGFFYLMTRDEYDQTLVYIPEKGRYLVRSCADIRFRRGVRYE